MMKTGGSSFTWNIDCNMTFPPGGVARIFVGKMAQGYSGPYNPDAMVAYGYSNDFNLTDSCSFSGVKPPATSPKPRRNTNSFRLNELKNNIKNILLQKKLKKFKRK